jgi:LEA14-like dessication related protein
MLRLLVAWCVVALLGACNLAPLERPTVQVRGAELRPVLEATAPSLGDVLSAGVRGAVEGAVSLAALEGQLSLDITNPNAIGLPLARLEWQLTVGGARAVTGAIDLAETIPARGTAPVVAEVRAEARDLVEVAAELVRGVRSYRLTGRLYFRTTWASVEVDVAHDGTFAELAGGR